MAVKTDNEIVNKISKVIDERNAYKKALQLIAKYPKGSEEVQLAKNTLKEFRNK